jgi:sorting nexin-8
LRKLLPYTVDAEGYYGLSVRSVGSEKSDSNAWTQGEDNLWSHVKAGLRSLGTYFGQLSEKSKDKAVQESEGLVENISMLLALVNAYQDLVDRREKGVMREHQAAIARMQTLKKHQGKLNARKDSRQAEWTDTADQLGEQIVSEEDHVHNVEMRNYFSLYCLHMEAQVISANMNQFAIIMQEMVDTQLRTSQQLHTIWEQMKPITAKILPPQSALSPGKKTEWDAMPSF